MRVLLVLLLAACDSGSNPSSSPDLALCHNDEAPTCCAGVCAQDACCDPACLSALNGLPCTPGFTCTFDLPDQVVGTFSCDGNGKLHCQSGTCLRADMGL